MIWIRRLLTIPLGLLLLALLTVALVFLQTADTLLNPDYYPEELSKANIYEFVLVDVATSAIDEARQSRDGALFEGFDQNPLATLGLSTQDLVASLNLVVPPQWAQAQVEQVFDEAGRYVIGESDAFQIHVPLKDRTAALVSEVKSLQRKADIYNLLFAEVVTPAIEDAVTSDLPLGLKLTAEEVEASVRRVVTQDWAQARSDDAVDQVTPYLTGERDAFEMRVPLLDRAEIALEEVKRLLRAADAYDLLYDEVIVPAVQDSFGSAVELPLGVTIANEEVRSALRQVAPVEWVQQQAEMVIDQAGTYLTGKADSFVATISLAENKRQARDLIVEIVARKLKERADRLPRCTLDQLARLALGSAQTLPECIPPGIQSDQIVKALEPGIQEGVDLYVLRSVPDSISFTEADLRQALVAAGASKNVDLLDDVREIVRDGWSYTDRDLRRDLQEEGGQEAVDRLDDVRSTLANGWTYTERDLREDIASIEDGPTLEDFDRIRTILSWALPWRLSIFLPVLLLLAAIGFLGEWRWSSRFALASAFLVIAAGVILIAFGPVYNIVIQPRVTEALAEARENALSDLDPSGDFQAPARLVADKLVEVAQSAADGFAWGIATKSVILLVVGVLGLIVSIWWDNIAALVRRPRD